ncbi:nucleoside deaminase [Desulfobacterales bacterium HSG2]|nr:nucleoside deaminase [Desulfobacterales bacterium HSG2]
MDYKYFMEKALEQADRALSRGEFPVGCVLAYQDRVIVTGARTGTSGDSANETDHAEMIALRELADRKEATEKREISLFCTLEPCLMCYGAILLSGIGEIVYAYEDVMGGGTRCDLSKLPPLYRDRQISIVPNILRNESLKLFKAFFEAPESDYWRGSLLAEYSLEQEI